MVIGALVEGPLPVLTWFRFLSGQREQVWVARRRGGREGWLRLEITACVSYQLVIVFFVLDRVLWTPLRWCLMGPASIDFLWRAWSLLCV